MRFDIYLQKTSNLYMKNLFLKFLVIVTGVVVVMNSYYTYRKVSAQRVVVIPAGFNERVEVGSYHADEKYIRMMTRYIAGLFLTYHPGNVRSQYSELLSLYHPSQYIRAKKLLYDLADRIEAAEVVSVFYLEGIEYTEDQGGIDIEFNGRLTLYAKGQEVEEERKRYLVKSRIEDGRFYIMDIEEKE